MQGPAGCATMHPRFDQQEFSSAFQRDKNFENRTIFGLVREILGFTVFRFTDFNDTIKSSSKFLVSISR